MNSMDGVNSTPKLTAELPGNSVQKSDKSLAQTAEDYVAIENRLAAQREKPQASSQFKSIFDELRTRMQK